jgi:hypothetical protein
LVTNKLAVIDAQSGWESLVGPDDHLRRAIAVAITTLRFQGLSFRFSLEPSSPRNYNPRSTLKLDDRDFRLVL